MRALNNHTIILSLIGLTAIDKDFSKKLTQIVITTALEPRFDTIIYTSYENGNAMRTADGEPFSDIPRSLAVGQDKPLLNIDTSPPIEKYMTKFNSELLSIAKLNQLMDQDERLLITLWQRLWHNTQTRLILLFDDSVSETYIEKMLFFCAQHKAMRVIALQPQLTVSERSYWVLLIFPTQRVLKRKLPTEGTQIFINHLDNMHGHPLRLIEHALCPQMYTYTPSNGGPSTMSGFLGRSLVEYAKHNNATIIYPISRHKTLSMHNEIGHFIGNNTIDIGSLTPYQSEDHYMSFSVVFYCTDYCLMVPMEQPISKSTFYYEHINGVIVILFCICVVSISCTWTLASRLHCQRTVFITNYFVDESVIRGLLGLPFWMPKRVSRLHKAICILITFAGLIFNTAYLTYLQSFTVDPSIAGRAETMADLTDRGIKIAAVRDNLFAMLDRPGFEKYAKNFVVFKNVTKFLMLQDSFDTRYAFAVTDMWIVYEVQQKYFSRPLFRHSDICLVKNYPMTLPLQENSIYRESLNKFIRRLHAAGLIKHWRKHSFLEMLDMDWVSLEDRNKQQRFQPLTVKDLQLTLLLMIVLMALSICCFILELCCPKIGYRLTSST